MRRGGDNLEVGGKPLDCFPVPVPVGMNPPRYAPEAAAVGQRTPNNRPPYSQLSRRAPAPVSQAWRGLARLCGLRSTPIKNSWPKRAPDAGQSGSRGNGPGMAPGADVIEETRFDGDEVSSKWFAREGRLSGFPLLIWLGPISPVSPISAFLLWVFFCAFSLPKRFPAKVWLHQGHRVIKSSDYNDPKKPTIEKH